MKFHLVINQSENSKYNLIQVDLARIRQDFAVCSHALHLEPAPISFVGTIFVHVMNCRTNTHTLANNHAIYTADEVAEWIEPWTRCW